MMRPETDCSTAELDRADALVCEAVASHPPDSNLKYIVDGAGTIVEDVVSGALVVNTSLELLEALGPEGITAAVLRGLATGRLRAHRESGQNDDPLRIVVITAALHLVN